MSISSRVDGWPKDSGPLPTLHQAGLLRDLDTRPVWAHYPKTFTDSAGQVTYKGSAKFMNATGLRALAALTLEGWAVSVNPTGETRELDITIRWER